MRLSSLVSAAGAVALLAACSSSGSSPASSPVTQSPAPQPTATSPSPLPTVPGETLTLPAVTEKFTVLPCPAHTPRTTLELEGCAEHKILRLDRRINHDAKALYDGMSDGHAQADFASAQEAWISYRSEACLSEADADAGGSLAAVTFANCAVRIDRQRLGDLEALLAASNG